MASLGKVGIDLINWMRWSFKVLKVIVCSSHFQCYYIGGLDTSATNILRIISKPISWHMPPEKVCGKLKDADSQICELKYGM